MATDKQRDALQTIFSFFLGLMVLAFIRVGVNAFYQSPAEKDAPQLQKLSRQQRAIETKTTKNGERPATDQAELGWLGFVKGRQVSAVERSRMASVRYLFSGGVA